MHSVIALVKFCCQFTKSVNSLNKIYTSHNCGLCIVLRARDADRPSNYYNIDYFVDEERMVQLHQ